MSGLRNIWESEWIDHLGWSLIHSLWQGMALFLLLWLILRIVPARYSHTRYLAGLFVMLLFLSLNIITLASLAAAGGGNSGPLQGMIDSAAPLKAIALRNEVVQEIRPYMSYAVAAWLAGSLIFMMRTFMGYQFLGRLRRHSLPAGKGWRERLDRMKELIGLEGNIRIGISERIDSPAVFGLIRPLILLPLSMASGLSTEQMDMILAHEMAHLKRKDYLFNQLQIIIESLFFFNPAVWLISSMIREEREYCCDDMALSLCGDRKHYVHMLAELEWTRVHPHVAAMAGQKNSLLKRIKRIMGKKTTQGNQAWLFIAIGLLITVSMVSWNSINRSDKINSEKVSIQPELSKLSGFSINNTHGLDTIPDMEELQQMIEQITREVMEKQKDVLKILGNEEFKRAMELHTVKMEELTRQLEQIKIEIPEFDFEDLQIDSDSLEKALQMSAGEIRRNMEKWSREHEEELREMERELREDVERMREKELLMRDELKEMEREVRKMESSIENFNRALSREMIRDGILEKGETVESIELEDGEIRKVNGRKFKPADPDKYKELVTRYLEGTKGHLKWHN